MNKKQLHQHIYYLGQYIIPFSVLLILIPTISTSMQYKTGLPIANTTLVWMVEAMVLFVFSISKKYFFDQNQEGVMRFVRWYLLWNILSVFHGILIADNYWDWKYLIDHMMTLLIPLMVFSATNKLIMQSIMRCFVKFGVPLFAIFSFLILPDAYGYYLAPIAFLSLFFPVLNSRWKLVVLSLSILVITIDLDARSNVIKFSIPFLLSLIFYFRLYISTKYFEFVRKLLFILPIVLFSMGANGIFNVFAFDDYIGGDFTTSVTTVDGENITVNLKADTRTFLYTEVLETADKYNSWLIGRSPAKGNESKLFADYDMSGRGERAGNEVAVLNIFTWTGTVGLILYLMVFYKASYLAVNQTNNTFSQILGIFLAFRWSYAWVEDINSFTLNYIFLWFLISLCYSKSFRVMSNKDVANWVQGIFYKREQIN